MTERATTQLEATGKLAQPRQQEEQTNMGGSAVLQKLQTLRLKLKESLSNKCRFKGAQILSGAQERNWQRREQQGNLTFERALLTYTQFCFRV